MARFIAWFRRTARTAPPLPALTRAGTNAATATRDLSDLVARGVLVGAGERRHARSDLTVPLRPAAPVAVDERGDLVEPEALSPKGAHF
jgi:hypothetical protein